MLLAFFCFNPSLRPKAERNHPSRPHFSPDCGMALCNDVMTCSAASIPLGYDHVAVHTTRTASRSTA
jgi:hypothetical protein